MFFCGAGGGDPQVITAAQKTMEGAAISVCQTPKDGLVNVPVGTTWLTQADVVKPSCALSHHNPVRMVRSAFPWSKFVMAMPTVWMDLMKWAVSNSYPGPHCSSPYMTYLYLTK